MACARVRRTRTRQGASKEDITAELAGMKEDESDEDEEISEDDDDDDDDDEGGKARSDQFYGIGADGKMGASAPPAPSHHRSLPAALGPAPHWPVSQHNHPYSPPPHHPFSRPRRMPLLQGRRRAALLRRLRKGMG